MSRRPTLEELAPWRVPSRLTLHPAMRIVACGAMVVLAQLLSLSILALAVMTATAAALIMARSRYLRLLRRVGWLLLPIVVLFAFFTPGTLLLPALGGLGPTIEGLQLAALHGLRLAAVVVCAALLLEYTPANRLVAGFYFLLRPLRFLGIDSGRIALRLMLVLRYADDPRSLREWRRWLAGESAPADEFLRVSLAAPPLSPADWACLAMLLLLFAGVVAA